MIDLLRTKSSLIKNGFFSYIFDNREDAVDYFLHFAKENISFGFAGSKTLETLGIYDILIDKGYKCFWHWKDGFKKGLDNCKDADYYLTSANAITSDGSLYFVDRIGNRISSVCFGHKKVFIFIGRNKIVADKAEAVRRAENIAIPLNSRRINNDIFKGLRSDDCVHYDDAANMELFLNASAKDRDIYVFLINEDLGY